MIYRFEEYELDVAQFELRRSGAVLKVEPQVFRLLEFLVSNHDRVVTKDEINEHVWGGRIVSEAALSSRISSARSAIGDSGKAQRFIRTVHGRGFRFASVPELARSGSSIGGEQPERVPDGDHITITSRGPSIAVLPFVDMSETGDQEYFSDGISEEILNALTKVPDLLVAGRTSSFSYRNRVADIREISAALNVDHVLEGSVRKQGERIRITAQLIQGEDGFHLWSETYDGTLDDIFDLQDKVSRAIADKLQLVLSIAEAPRLVDELTQSTEAYDLYLKARSELYGPTTEATYHRAYSLLDRALRIDPSFSAAWALLSRVHLNHSAYVWTGSARESFDKIEFAVSRALEADRTSVDALAVASQHSVIGGNCLTGFDQARRALELEPNNPVLLHNWGHINCQLGYCEDAITAMERAVSIDPVYSGYWNNLAVAYQNIGDFESAEHRAHRAVELGDYAGYTTLAWNAHAQGDGEVAERNMVDMFRKYGAQLGEAGGQEQMWRIVAGGLFLGSDVDRDTVRSWVMSQSEQPGFEPSGLSINGAAQFGLAEQFYDQWTPSYFAKGNLGLLLWSEFDWARRLREHSGFAAFAGAAGFVEVWDRHGKPASFS